MFSNIKVNNINSINISNNCPNLIGSTSDCEEGLNLKAFIIYEIISKSKAIGKKRLNIIAKINNIPLFNNDNTIRKSELIRKNMSLLYKISLDINQNIDTMIQAEEKEEIVQQLIQLSKLKNKMK